jgi:K+-transporting ATPase ATPase C chain
MIKLLIRSVVVTLVLCVLLCGVYPVAVTLFAQVLFPEQAKGSLVLKEGKVVGSRLIGQAFGRPGYFHGRPSAAGDKGYDAANSSGSNLGPTSRKLADRLKADIDALIKENPTMAKGEIPVDLVTASGSGLDPHISPEAALAQVDRVSKSRHADPKQIEQIVLAQVEDRELGFLGEKRVNVLLLNLALDEKMPVNR